MDDPIIKMLIMGILTPIACVLIVGPWVIVYESCKRGVSKEDTSEIIVIMCLLFCIFEASTALDWLLK